MIMMIKKVFASILLVTCIVMGSVKAVAETQGTNWKTYAWQTCWSSNTRKAATIGGGLATLAGLYFLYKKYSAQPSQEYKPYKAQEEQSEVTPETSSDEAIARALQEEEDRKIAQHEQSLDQRAKEQQLRQYQTNTMGRGGYRGGTLVRSYRK